jgi:hypothetical protein
MPVLVGSYSKVKKNDEQGELKPFNTFRAVGLAVEKAHSFCKAHGLGKLTQEGGWQEVSTVELSGPSLQIEDQGRWRKVQCCSLKLNTEDAQFAVRVVVQQRETLAELAINLWQADARPFRMRS